MENGGIILEPKLKKKRISFYESFKNESEAIVYHKKAISNVTLKQQKVRLSSVLKEIKNLPRLKMSQK